MKSIHNIHSAWELSCLQYGVEHAGILSLIPFVCDGLVMTECKFAQYKKHCGSGLVFLRECVDLN